MPTKRIDRSKPPAWAQLATDLIYSPNARASARRLTLFTPYVLMSLHGMRIGGYDHQTQLQNGTKVETKLAETWLTDDLTEASLLLHRTIERELTQAQYDVLTCWIFWNGSEQWQQSQALQMLRIGWYDGCINHLMLEYRKAARDETLLRNQNAALWNLWRTLDAKQAGPEVQVPARP